MSHVTALEFECNSLKHLKNGVNEVPELEFVEGLTKHKYYSGQYAPCDHVIRLKGDTGAYEIGVIDKKDGTFGLNWDSFAGGRGLVNVVGKNCARIKKEYNAQVTMEQLRMKGFRHFKRTWNEQNNLVLEAT